MPTRRHVPVLVFVLVAGLCLVLACGFFLAGDRRAVLAPATGAFGFILGCTATLLFGWKRIRARRGPRS